jgi:uncharacterized membrane protein
MRKTLFALVGTCLISTVAMAQTPPPEMGREGGHRQHRGERMHHDTMMNKLSAEGRKILEADMQDGKNKMEANMTSRKAARDKIRAAMIAEPYNAATLSAAFADERALAGAQQKQHHDHMTSVMGKLSAADRKIFAESMGNMEMRMRIIKKDRSGKVVEDRMQ